ncbi:MAG: hypothetical protein PHI27_12335 [Eubacteriales bacterium]|nr:hypothetical protein [Eubacteriales bacterium]
MNTNEFAACAAVKRRLAPKWSVVFIEQRCHRRMTLNPAVNYHGDLTLVNIISKINMIL